MTDEILFFIGLSSGLVTSAALFALIERRTIKRRDTQFAWDKWFIIETTVWTNEQNNHHPNFQKHRDDSVTGGA